MHIAKAVDAVKNDKTITALRRFKLLFTVFNHCSEKMEREIIPSRIENHGFKTIVVRVGNEPPNSIYISLNSRAILGKVNNPKIWPTM